jgi:carbon monoxide dehydrogenase subunit G
MSIDVTAEVRIDRDPQAVWDFMTDPQHEPEWIGGLKTAQLQGDPPMRVGSRVERVASFLGRRIEYVNEVTQMEPPRLLEMQSVIAPFPMRITYTLDGNTVRNRVRGGGSRLLAPLVRRNIQRDLKRLKALIERP